MGHGPAKSRRQAGKWWRVGIVSRLCGCGRAEWRAAFTQRIYPLFAPSPDLILLSAGFDGGE